MKVTKKFICLALIAAMIVSCFVVTGLSASAASGKLAKYYTTNAGGKAGVKKTIKIDGDGSDWSEDMRIATSGAWDVANHWKGAHENCLIDACGLFAAWDSDNLYIGMQYVNTTDTWQNAGDASLMDGGKMGDLHLILALSVDPSKKGLTGKVSSGDYIWGDKIDYKSHVDHLFYMSTKAGLGTPGHFTVADSSGNTDYTTHCGNFKNEGIEYKMYDGNVCDSIWGLNDSNSPDDVCSDSANWVDYKSFKGSKGVHNTKYDSFYEIKIPLKVLGITESQLTSKGIGAMTLCGRGESALDCCPFDLSMVDNVKGNYTQDPSTSKEKDDIDEITAPLARVGKFTGTITPAVGDETEPATEPDTATEEPSTVTEPETTTEPTTMTEPTTTTEPPTITSFERGDVNRDTYLNIKDATEIQKMLAKLTEFDDEQMYLADFNEDDAVNVKDATAIQRKLAQLD
ncbi:MAG: dockerin type I repeat-containing protein [Ruminococcus sp.]|nr:dockerin type I repeat-containing protein [Ruminococcus sp.]